MKPIKHSPIPGTRPLSAMEINCLHFTGEHTPVTPRPKPVTPTDVKVNL